MTGSEKRWKKSHTLIATAAIVLLVGGIVTGTVLINRDTTPPTADTSTSAPPTSTPTPDATTPTPDGDSSSEGGTMQPTPIGGNVLPETMGGEDAIEALGDKIEFVATRNNKTVDELKDLLLRDKTAQVTPSGFIVYKDTFTG